MGAPLARSRQRAQVPARGDTGTWGCRWPPPAEPPGDGTAGEAAPSRPAKGKFLLWGKGRMRGGGSGSWSFLLKTFPWQFLWGFVLPPALQVLPAARGLLAARRCSPWGMLVAGQRGAGPARGGLGTARSEPPRRRTACWRGFPTVGISKLPGKHAWSSLLWVGHEWAGWLWGCCSSHPLVLEPLRPIPPALCCLECSGLCGLPVAFPAALRPGLDNLSRAEKAAGAEKPSSIMQIY